MAEKIVRRFEVFDLDAPGTDTDIMATYLAPGPGGYRFRVQIALASGGVVNVISKGSGGTPSLTWGLNESVAIAAGDLAEFEHAVQLTPVGGGGITYNYQIESATGVQCLIVDELVAE